MGQLSFEWDRAKRLANIEKHGVDFIRASEIFEGAICEALDDRLDYGDDRWFGYGLAQGILLKVVFTRQDDLIRLISAQKANRREREAYFRSVHF